MLSKNDGRYETFGSKIASPEMMKRALNSAKNDSSGVLGTPGELVRFAEDTLLIMSPSFARSSHTGDSRCARERVPGT